MLNDERRTLNVEQKSGSAELAGKGNIFYGVILKGNFTYMLRTVFILLIFKGFSCG